MVLFESGNGLGLAVLQNLKVVFMQASNSLPFRIGHNDVYKDQSNLSFDCGCGFVRFRSRSLGLEEHSSRQQRNETESATRTADCQDASCYGRQRGWHASLLPA